MVVDGAELPWPSTPFTVPVTVWTAPRTLGVGTDGTVGVGTLGVFGTLGGGGGGGTGSFGTVGTVIVGTVTVTVGRVGTPELNAVPDHAPRKPAHASAIQPTFFHSRCPDRICCDNRSGPEKVSLTSARRMQTAKTDYYEVLGVAPSADDEEIKRAFRSLARELHPDVSTDPDAEEKFREASEAYGVLSKPATRLLYDRFGFRGRGNGWFGPPGRGASGHFPEDLLDRVFHAGRRRREEAVAEIQLDPYEAERGVTRTVDYVTSETCDACGGDGAAPGALRATCPACDGTGRRTERANLEEARLLQIETCPHCRGRGELLSEMCPRCYGAGDLEVERRTEVKVRAGVENGERVELEGGSPDRVPYAVVTIRRFRHDSALVRGLALVGFLAAAAFFVLLVTR